MIPPFAEFIKPLLEMCVDRCEHNLDQAREMAIAHFNLTEEDQSQMLDSGRQRTYDNRVQWAKQYLTQAKCLETTGRGKFRITDRGIELVDKKHEIITPDILKQYQEFREFSNTDIKNETEQTIEEVKIEQLSTPDEELDRVLLNIKENVLRQIKDKISQISHKGFEQLIVDLMVAMGYGTGFVTGKSGDEGIDAIINQDALGINVIYMQAKHYAENVKVTSEQLQTFVGALSVKKVQKGVFITSSVFTQPAIDLAKQVDSRIILIDGTKLVELMYQYGLGLSTRISIPIKKIDTDYFDELI